MTDLTYRPGPNEIVLQYSTEYLSARLKLPDPMAALIRLAGRSPWSHVDIVLPSGQLLGARLFGPGGRGVRIREPDYANFAHAMRVSIHSKNAAKFYALAEKQVGKPYDWIGILGFMFPLLVPRLTPADWQNPEAWPRFFCDHMVLVLLEAIGNWVRPLVMSPDHITPGGSWLVIAAGPSYRMVERF